MYVDELLFCVSLADPKSLVRGNNLFILWFTERNFRKSQAATQRLEAMVDICGFLVFANICGGQAGRFASGIGCNNGDAQCLAGFFLGEGKYFVKLNRDNPVLEKEADRFLENAGHTDSDFDDDALARGESSDDTDELGLQARMMKPNWKKW